MESKKYNVHCCHCGRKEFNPNIPATHILDACSNEKCVKEAGDLFVVFKDGNITNCSVSNLYRVTKDTVKNILAK